MKIIRVTIKDSILTKGENGLEYKEKVFPFELPYSEENMKWAEENCVEGVPEVLERTEPYPVAPCNITAGEYVSIGNVLYKATGNIPNGEPVIVGQNAIATTVEEQLYELKGE